MGGGTDPPSNLRSASRSDAWGEEHPLSSPNAIQVRIHDNARPFFIGANLPWVGYGTDFGASSWYASGGLSAQPAALARLDQTLHALGEDGIAIVRLFVLCDGRSGIRFNEDGLPIGPDSSLFADMDALIAAARRHDTQLMPVLLDSHLCNPPRIVDGVQLGGRAQLMTSPQGRAALIDHVLQPLVERYSDEEAIAAWDVMNEPEWCLDPPRSVPFEAVQRFLRMAVERVKATARQPVTVGSAGTWRLDLVRPLGLNFYQVHWYERFGWRALERPVAALGLDRPVMLGEFSGRSARVASVLDAARRAGYRGALVWSVLADDDQSGYPVEIGRWMRAQTDTSLNRGVRRDA